MAYDDGLATRLLGILGGETGLATRKMFGGLACGARIHDRGGDLLLLAAGRGRQAAIWYSCVSPPRTCFRRIRCSARLIVVLIDNQQPVEDFPAQGTDHRFADRVRSRRLRRAGENPDACREHGVEGAGELACAIPDQELDRGRELPGVDQEIAGCCVVQAPSGFAVMPARWARRVPGSGDDQGIGAAEQHGIHMDEVGGGEAAGLRGQELLPRWARAAWCGVDPGRFPVGCR